MSIYITGMRFIRKWRDNTIWDLRTEEDKQVETSR